MVHHLAFAVVACLATARGNLTIENRAPGLGAIEADREVGKRRSDAGSSYRATARGLSERRLRRGDHADGAQRSAAVTWNGRPGANRAALVVDWIREYPAFTFWANRRPLER